MSRLRVENVNAFRRLLAVSLPGMMAAVALAGADVNDWLIVPGKRVGPITPSTTRADLTRLFGAKNVEDTDILLSDGGHEPGTKIFSDRPEMSLAIIWKGDDADARVRNVIVCHGIEPATACKWHTAEGITFGTPLKTLERLNGRKFKLNGFDWGYGGLATSWDTGKLETLAAACGRVTLRLDPPPGPASEERSRLLEDVEGDAEFWSSEPAMQALNPVVDWMGVSFVNCNP